MSEHKSFPKIPRVEKIDVIVTEKVDGTNGLVHVEHLDTGITFIQVGSRNRWLTNEDDNHGFHKFCEANAEYLNRLPDGYHYGEYAGKGINKRYNVDKKFYLFDIRLKDLDLGPNITTVPHIVDGNVLDINSFKYYSRFSEIDKEAKAEGLMFFFPAFKHYTKLIWDK